MKLFDALGGSIAREVVVLVGWQMYLPQAGFEELKKATAGTEIFPCSASFCAGPHPL